MNLITVSRSKSTRVLLISLGFLAGVFLPAQNAWAQG